MQKNKTRIQFTPWPAELATIYRQNGYWRDKHLFNILEDTSKKYPNQVALICADRQFTYSDIENLSTNLANNLSIKGYGLGNTALVQLPNVAEFYIVFFALLKAGITPLNALYSHRQYELEGFSEQIQPDIMIVSQHHEVFSNNKFLATLKEKSIQPSLILKLDAPAEEYNLKNWLKPLFLEKVDLSPTEPDEVAFFQLSGGSTNVPKLIPRTHNDYEYSVRASAELCRLDSNTRLLCALPAPHNFMLSSPGVLGLFYAGGCAVLASSPEPTLCFSLIQQHQVSMVSLVPSAVIAWLKESKNTKENLSSLQLMQVGGANFSESLARQIPEVFGCQLQQVFGMAEGLVNYTRLDDDDELVFTTQGYPLCPDDEIKIVDEYNLPVLGEQVGRLAVRGPYTFRGYYKNPEQNHQVFDEDGFYHTGDLVQMTDEGYIKVVGRVKDQVNRGGEKIAAEEIEDLIIQHPDIRNVAIVGFADEQFGEKSCAFIVTDNLKINAITLRRYLYERGIAEYKLPDMVELINDMPLTAVGKTDKKQLRHILSNKLANFITT